MDCFRNSLPYVSPFEFLYLKEVDLNNYYVESGNDRFVNCQICKSNILRDRLFEHTVSKRHKYNKLLVSIVQNSSDNVDVDFVVLNIDKIQCRYCESLIIYVNENENDLEIITHIQDTRHKEKKQAYLDGISTGQGWGNSIIKSDLLKPLDSLITHDKEYKQHTNKLGEDIENRISLAEESEQTTKELEDTTNFNQNTALQWTVFLRDYEQEKGEELPNCITTGEGNTCECTICLVKITTSIYSIGEHINGKNHKKKAGQLEKSMSQQTELQFTINKLTENNSLARNSIEELEQLMKDLKNEIKLRQKSAQQKHKQNMREVVGTTIEKLELQDMVSEITQQIRVCQNIIEESEQTKNLQDMNKVQQDSASSSEREVQSGQESMDYITLGENGSHVCTICKIDIPNTPHNIAHHINGNNHTQKIVEAMQLELHNTIDRLIEPLEKWKRIIDESKQMTKELSAVNNDDQNNVPQSAAPAIDKEIGSLDCISFGENGVRICTICLIKIPNTSYNIDEHVNGKKHKKTMLELVEAASQKAKLKDTNKSLPAPVNTVTNCTYMCAICLIIISSDENSRKVHNDGKNHKKKLRQCQISVENIEYLRKENLSNLISIVGNLHFCKICEKYLPEYSLIKEHIDSKKHKDKISETPESAPIEDNENVSSASAINKEIQRLQGLLDCFSIKEDGTHVCKICLTQIPNTTYNIDQHINGNKHKGKLRERQISAENLQYLTDGNLSNIIKVVGDSHFCKICDKYLPEHSLVKDHIESKKHKEKVPETSRSTENTKNKDENTDVSPCHIDSTVNFTTIDGTWVCKTCRVAISNLSLIDDHVKSSNHEKNMQEIAKRLVGYEHDEKLCVCKVCSKLLCKVNRDSHMNSKNHQLNILKYHTLYL